jgi:hypothetical protein
LKIITGELASREAVAQAKVDRSTIVALRETAKDVAIAAFQVSAFLRTEASPMLVTTVGVPDYRPRPGKRPAEMQRLRVQLT